MAFEPFGLVGGVTVGIPPVLVIDSNGNVTSNRGNIANLSTAVINSSGNITAPFFIGNIVGNVSGNFVVPGTNTSVIFNQEGNAGASDNLQFNYSTNVLSLTGNITVTNILTDNYLYANGAPYVFAAQASGSNTQIQFNTAGLLDASANLTFDSSNQTFATDNISAVTAVITELESDNVLVTGNVVAANVTANFIGNLSNANLVSANFFTGVLTTNAQPNITSVGTLSGLTLAGNIIPAADNLYNLGSNVARWKDLYLTGNTIYIGNATIESNATSLVFTNPNGSNYVFGENDFSITGNISAGGNLSIGNISAGNLVTANFVTGILTTQSQPNITTVGTLGNLSVAGNINTGNISAVTRVTANQISGLLITGAQPNVTSVGTLASLSVTGNITTGNGVFVGNGSGLSQITAANIVGSVPNAAYATNAGTATTATNALTANTANIANVANTATTAETVTTNAQPNITSVGTLTTLTVAGNVNADNFVGNFVGNITSANFAYYAGNVTVASQPNITSVGTLASLAVNGPITAANITANTGRFIGNGSGLSQLAAANIVGTVANANYAITAGTTTTAGTVTTNAQPNITSVGTLTALTVSGNITGSNVTGGNLVSANYFTGILTTSAQPNVTSVGTLTSLAVSGNITATNITSTTGRFAGNGSGLTNLSGANVVGNVANATYATNAGNSTTAGTVTTNAQPNITSVGTLTSLDVTGNITGGNIAGGNLVSANYVTGTLITASQPNITSVGTLTALTVTGNFTAANITASTGKFTGNGRGLTNLTGANVIGTVANATYALSAGNSSTAGTVTTNAQPNITSVGTLTALTVSGNITGANVAGGNLVSANYVTGTLITGAQPNITSTGTLTSLTVTGNLTAANITASTGKFTGNGSGLSQLAGANVVGAVANATYAVSAGSSNTSGTVTTNAQPNITSVGTLTTLTSSGNITAPYFIGNVVGNISGNFVVPGTNTSVIFNQEGNAGASDALQFNYSSNVLTANGNIIATYFIGNGSRLSQLTGSNVVGTVANATYAVSAGSSNIAGTVTTNAQPNITSVGTLTSLDVTGNITGANVAGGNLVSANYVTGRLTTPAQPNITSVGTLTSLSSSGNITAPYFFGNLIGNIDDANYASYAGNVVNPLQPNITTVGTLTDLSVSGNIIGGNLVSANFLTGTLTTQTQSNIHIVGNLEFLNVDTSLPGANGNITFNGSMSGTGPQSDIDITGDLYVSNIYSTIVAGVLSTNEQPNVTLVGTLTELTVRGPVDLGSVSNLTITGGNANYVLSTNGLGNLSWEPIGTGTAGGTNTQVQFNNQGTLDGNSAFTFNNTTKTLTVLGNITSNSTIQSSRFISNVATGTSPFVVTSTTKVANLSVETANNATFATFAINSTNANVALTVANAAQPNITSVGTLTTLTVSGNITSNSTIQSSRFISTVASGTSPFVVTSTTKVANLSVETANTANIANTASFSNNSTNANVALTVSNAAQPNITSVGTLTALNVNGAGSITGNIRVGNLDTNGTIITTNANVIGNANVNGNLQVGSAGQLRVLGTVNTDGSSNVNLGNVSNIHITGGLNGYVLSTDGAGNLTWAAGGGGGGGNGVPGGSNTQVQYNDNGLFGGSAFLTFNENTNTFQVAGNLVANGIQVGAGIYKFSTQYVYFATTASTASDQVLWSTLASNVSGVDFHIIATDSTGATRQSAKISSLLYGNSVVWNEYGGLQLNGGTGSFSIEYNAGNIIIQPSVRLLVTPDSSNSTTYKMMITEYTP